MSCLTRENLNSKIGNYAGLVFTFKNVLYCIIPILQILDYAQFDTGKINFHRENHFRNSIY